MSELQVSIMHDDTHYGRPPQDDYDTLYRVVSFDTRDFNYEDPAQWFACTYEDCGLQDADHEAFNLLYPNEAHEFTPSTDAPTLYALLSKYEHGGVSWSLRGEGMQDPWDSTDIAGALIVAQSNEWEGMPEDLRRSNALAEIEQFNQWANGEIYGVRVERTAGACPHCEQALPPEDIDELWGLYGIDSVNEFISEAVGRELGVAPEDVERDTHYRLVDSVW